MLNRAQFHFIIVPPFGEKYFLKRCHEDPLTKLKARLNEEGKCSFYIYWSDKCLEESEEGIKIIDANSHILTIFTINLCKNLLSAGERGVCTKWLQSSRHWLPRPGWVQPHQGFSLIMVEIWWIQTVPWQHLKLDCSPFSTWRWVSINIMKQISICRAEVYWWYRWSTFLTYSNFTSVILV